MRLDHLLSKEYRDTLVRQESGVVERMLFNFEGTSFLKKEEEDPVRSKQVGV